MGVRLQQRDVYLLELLSDTYLLLTREQIQELVPRAKRRTNQRLAVLIRSKFLMRRRSENAWEPRIVFYYIGEAAADYVGVPLVKIRERIAAAKSYSPSFLKHLFLITDVHIKFLNGEGKEYELVSTIPSGDKLWGNITNLQRRPDLYMHLRRGTVVIPCFLEIDRGTEKGKVIREKIDAYAHFDRSKSFQRIFNADWFHVLFITEKVSRAKMLVKLFPSETFLVMTWTDFKASNVLDAKWQTKGGKLVAFDFPPSHATPRPVPEPPSPPPKPKVPIPPTSMLDPTREAPQLSEMTEFEEWELREAWRRIRMVALLVVGGAFLGLLCLAGLHLVWMFLRWFMPMLQYPTR